MWISLVLALLAASTIQSPGVAAAAPGQTPPSAPRQAPDKPPSLFGQPSKDPFGKLLTTPPERITDISPKPRVVCGTVVIQADPSIDPRMVIKRRPDASAQPKIRVIDPPACKQ
jgi:hypothetical protein